MAKRLKRRVILRITTQRKLEGLALRHRLKPVTAINRVVSWIVKQPEVIQAVVLGRFSGQLSAELVELIIRSMKRS
jgi:hypothetical protein